MDLRNKRALVTGGAAGIGFATSMRLARAGCSVGICDIDPGALERARQTLSTFGVPVVALRCDVTDPNAVGEMIRTAESAFGGIDILVNNAGFMAPGNFLDRPVADWAKTIDVNVQAILYTTHAVLPGMYARGEGHVVNVSSAAGTIGVAGLAAYAASKWAVWGLTESLRNETWNLGVRGVRFSSVHPYYVAEGLFAGARVRGIGALIVPRLKNHDVVARAIVEAALKRGRFSPKRPRSVRLAVLLRGILPDAAFQRVVRFLGIHRSMSTWKGKGNGETS